MKRPLDTTSSIGRGSVHADEIMSLREFGRRLGLANKALCDAQKAGLKTATVGVRKYIVGSQAVAWFAQQADKQAEIK